MFPRGKKLFGELLLDLSWELMKRINENGKFSLETWRISGCEKNSLMQGEAGVPEDASPSGCEVVAWAPGMEASFTLAPGKVLFTPLIPYRMQNKKPAWGFTVTYHKVLLVKLFFSHTQNIFRWESSPKEQTVLEINRGWGGGGGGVQWEHFLRVCVRETSWHALFRMEPESVIWIITLALLMMH